MHFSALRITANAYILCVLALLRNNSKFLLGWGLAALGLRLLFVFCFPAVVDDSRLYADIAENWLRHAVYGITNSGHIMPTLSRLPGYPAFLAAVFAVFGTNNFRAVLLIQVLFDLGTCLLIADLGCRMLSERAAKAAFVLASLCPFLANYAAAALTEALEIFFTALALDLAIAGIERLRSEEDSASKPGWVCWLACGFAISACLLLRPDGGILLCAAVGYLLLFFLRRRRRVSVHEERSDRAHDLAAVSLSAIVLALAALAPLVPWTVRNLLSLRRFEPLAPRYATDSDESVLAGFNRWTKTWMAEYTSVEEIYWNVPGESIDVSKLPDRAFDSPEQREQTEQLFAEYNRDHDMSPELDARFAALAAQRIHASPLRYYLWLPALRITDMWLRPRTELLPSDPRWWEFNDETRWLAASLAFGLISLFYVAAALAGLVRSRHINGVGFLLIFVILRSLFLATLENPEPRYTLECYPVVIFLAAACFMHKTHGDDRKPA
jgi:4-amino-4-deoxy-L-arabinose transferase-like glycosyltransferase